MNEGNQAKTVTVLFVDDSVTDRTRGVGLLRKQKPAWNVIAASSGSEGLECLNSESVDLVVTDLVMPGMDGRQFLQAINERYPEVPVVLITSQGNDQIAAQSMELGAVNYVPKRRLGDDLVPALEDILKAQRESSMARDVMRHVVRNRSQFSIDNDLEQVRALVNLIRDRLHSLHRFPAETVVNLTAAVREALLNAYFHGNLELDCTPASGSGDDYLQLAEDRKQNPDFAGRQIGLEMLLESRQLLFRISSDGRGFDTDLLVNRPAVSANETHNGFRYIRDHVDSITFNETGNQITLTKSLPAARQPSSAAAPH